MRWKVALPALSRDIMVTPRSKLLQWQLMIVAIWVIFTLLAFGYFIADKLVDFDKQGKLKAVTKQQLSSSLNVYLKDAGQDSENTILHFSQANCQCQQVSQSHIQGLDKIALANEFNVINVRLDGHHFIPATPSVAIVNRDGGIIYFGPYGSGLACSQTSGYAQTMLKNFLKGYEASFIVKQASGCYCQV